MTDSLTYADAGVDIDKANELVRSIRDIARQTPQSGVLGDIGGFGGLYSLEAAQTGQPVLVSSTDGVGTKLKLAFMLDEHNTVGIDLVGMCVNDIIVQGARPLFFLDYFSMGQLEPRVVTAVIAGIAEGCRQAGCALIGGETAEMPDMYQPGEYDLAGFSVGLVDKTDIIDGSQIKVGHQLIGIESSGVHSNGFSLVRKICFDRLKLDVGAYIPELAKSIGEELLTPTKIYVSSIIELIENFPIHGLAHITGGGLAENIERVVPDQMGIVLRRNSWQIPPIFPFLKQAGNVTEEEMFRTFNNGIGMVAIVPEKIVESVLQRLAGIDQKGFVIGEIVAGSAGRRTKWV